MRNVINWFEIKAKDFARAMKFNLEVLNLDMQEIPSGPGRENAIICLNGPNDLKNALLRVKSSRDRIFMKNLVNSFLLSFFIAISFTGCNTDSTDDETQESTGDYWPTSIDNNWVYTQGSVETSIKITATDEIEGIKYYKFNQSAIFGAAIQGQAPAWIKKNKGDYYIKIEELNIESEGVISKITGYEFLFFKDYLEVNDTWAGSYTFTQSYNTTNLSVLIAKVNYTGKILEKGISLTINGKVFNDVIKFRFAQSIKGNDAWPSWDYSTDYWIAKNVGIIKFTSNEVVSEYKSHVIK